MTSCQCTGTARGADCRYCYYVHYA